MAKGMKSTREPKDDVGIPKIEFTTNWNGKLFTDSFTTLRMWNESKYVIGRDYRIITPVKDKVHNAPMIWGQAKLIAAKRLFIPQINDYIAYLDTGYDAESTKNILRNMYKNMIADRNIEEEPFGLYLLVKQYK